MTQVIFYFLIGLSLALGGSIDDVSNDSEYPPIDLEQEDFAVDKNKIEDDVNATWLNYDYVDINDNETAKARASFTISCPKNEEISPCIRLCESCESYTTPLFCVAVCYPNRRRKCYCKSEYHRLPTGQCVPSNQCPKSSPKQLCGQNEKWYDCGPCKEAQQCKNKGKAVICTADCKPSGCYCSPGSYRHPLTGRCVPASCCPPAQDRIYSDSRSLEQVPVCSGENEIYWDQRNICEEFTCGLFFPIPTSNRPALNCRPIQRSGCFCQLGYYRDLEEQRCVPCGRRP